MKKYPGVLFIADTSLTNPILSSQGIPLLEFLSSNGFRCMLLTFETMSSLRNIHAKSNYNNKIKFLKVTIVHNMCPDWLKILFKGTIKVLKHINKDAIDVLHARSFTPAIISLIIKNIYRTNIRFIYDNRGLFIEEQVYLGKWSKSGVKVKIARWLEYMIFKNSDKIIVVSHQFRNYLSEKFGKQFDHKIIVIRNRTKIIPIKGTEKPNKKITGIFSGSGAKWQNIPELNNLFEAVSEINSNIEFKIFTYKDINQPGENNLIKERTNVKLYSLNPVEVKQKMQGGDFGILLREEIQLNKVSSPLKFSEYLSCGLPVLLTKGIGDTEEIINKYGVGVIIRNKDYISAVSELLKLLNDPSIREKCFSVAEKEFNIVDSFNEYKKVYKELASD